MNEAPPNNSIWTTQSMSLLPRWGGYQGASVNMSAKVADKIGGHEGDILYAQIARSKYSFYTWPTLFEEAEFDKNRVMRGLIGICERSPNLYAANQALIVARLIDDHTSASKIARLWMKNHHSCVHRLWDWDHKKFNDTMNWALADAPLKAEEANAEPAKQDSLSA